MSLSGRNGLILQSVSLEEKENMRLLVDQNIRIMKTKGIVPGEKKKSLYQILTTTTSEKV